MADILTQDIEKRYLDDLKELNAKIPPVELLDDDLTAAELDLSDWKAVPLPERFDCDGPGHGSVAAESNYRESFQQAVHESLALLTTNEDDDAPTIAELFDLAGERRCNACQAAMVGEHVPRFRIGHETEAAKLRGRHQAFGQVMRVVTHVDSFDEVVGVLANWSSTLEKWNQDDLASPIPPPALPIREPKETPPDVVVEPEGVPPSRWHAGFPSTLLNVPGFVGEFVRHCVFTAKRPQPELALATALALLGTLVGRKLRDRLDSRANVFFVGLAGTGAGKEHSRHVAKMLLVAIHRDRKFVESFASAPAIVSRVADQFDVLALVDEFGRYLKTSTSKNAESFLAKIPTVMMKLFSTSNSLYIGDIYADSKHNAAKVIAAPNLYVFATTVADNFFAALSSENALDGLLNRFLIFQVSNDLPRLQDAEPQPLPESLISAAKYWSELVVGDGNLNESLPLPRLIEETPEASSRLREFGEHCDDIARASRTIGGRGLWVRTLEKARKLAMLYAASESREPRITLAAAEWAAQFATHCTRFVEQAAGEWISDSPHQANVKRVMRFIDAAGIDGLSQSELTSRMDHALAARDFTCIVTELSNAGKIVPWEVATAGRKRTMMRAARFG